MISPFWKVEQTNLYSRGTAYLGFLERRIEKAHSEFTKGEDIVPRELIELVIIVSSKVLRKYIAHN